MTPEEAVIFAIRLGTISVGLLGGTVYFLQRRLSVVYRLSSLMFLVFVLSQVFYVVEVIWPSMRAGLHHAFHMLSFTATFLLLPSFFIHLRTLSRPANPMRWREVTLHFALPVTVAFFAAISLLIPSELIGPLKQEIAVASAAPWMNFIAEALLHFELLGCLLVVWYVWIVLQWQRKQRDLQADAYAARLGHARLWSFALVATLLFYVIEASLVYFAHGHGLAHPLRPIEQSIATLVFISLVTVRGLQQAPELYAPKREAAVKPEKYAKSALVSDRAHRIARKIGDAMAQDKLHHDANLTLPKLAEHIGSSPNYVSQTLNEHLEQSFFDYLNHWRIRDAQRLLQESNDTILSIAYAVGFNSRSAFYTAFKKHTSMTPSEFRSRNIDRARSPRRVATS